MWVVVPCLDFVLVPVVGGWWGTRRHVPVDLGLSSDDKGGVRPLPSGGAVRIVDGLFR